MRRILSCFIILLSAAGFPAYGQTRIITTVAGSTFVFPRDVTSAINAPLGFMTSVAADGQGGFYAADYIDNIVIHVDTGGALSIVAGNGIYAFSGDGGPAVSASLALAHFELGGIAVDSSGNLFISDNGNQRIRKVTPGGIVTTVAGNGTQGFSGDGGPAIAASLATPTGIAVDSAGNLFVVDSANFRVRKISASGVITTVAGNGTNAFAGDGGPAVSASLNLPEGIAVDQAGDIFIAEYQNRIRKVSAATGLIATIAGNGSNGNSGDGGPAASAVLNQPVGLAFDSAGNLYIADSGNNRIREISTAGIITTVAGSGGGGGASNFGGDGGPALMASLLEPSGVAVDAAGNLFIADSGENGGNKRIRKVSGGTITTVAGNGLFRFAGDGGPATSAQLNSPSGVVSDNAGNLYIADSVNSRIRKVASSGAIATIAGNGTYGFAGDGGPATAAELREPVSVALDGAGDVFFTDILTGRVREVSSSTGTITTAAGNGNYAFAGDGGLATAAALNYPFGIAFDASGDLLIADQENNRVRKVSPGGVITTIAGNGTAAFSGDGGQATSASLNFPVAVAADAAGDIFVVDQGNYRVRKIAPSGVIGTVAGNGSEMNSGDGGPAVSAGLFIPAEVPGGVAVDQSGNLFISTLGDVRMVSGSTGTISTFAGMGNNGRGDGGPANQAQLISPRGLAVDAAGNVFIADGADERIRVVLAQPPALQVSPATIALTASSNGKPATATFTVLTSATATIPIAVPGMPYTASVTSGSSWLSLSSASGSTPGLITVTADPTNLTPGTMNGTIVINVPTANPATQTVSVQFMVTAASPPVLSLDQSHMSFTYATTSAPRSQTLIVSNTGGGTLNFTTSIVLNSGVAANWLSVAPSSGTATPGRPVSLAVTADPTKLGPGTYTASLTVNGGAAGSATIPITITITPNPLVLLLSQAGLTFTAIQNGGLTPPQTFGVLNLGSGTLNWTVETSTLSGGNWLNATPSNGTSTSASATGAPLVTVSVNQAGLAPGIYYGLVKVVSAGAANTPQEVVAVLQVLPAGSDVAPIVQPTSLIFNSPAGVSSPSSQSAFVYDPTGTGKSFRSGVVTSSGGNWLVTQPTDATIPANDSVQITVQPVVNGLAPGTYNGTVTLQFSDGRVSTIGVTFVVTGAGAATSEKPGAIPHDSGSCTPTKLIPVLTTLGQGFTVPAGFPEGLTAQIADDCGNPLTQGQVSVEFSNGQGLKYMQSLNSGRWDVTWNTGSQQASSVTLTVTAMHPTLPISGAAQITGALGALQSPPQVADKGVVSSASFTATPVAPGGFISVFGSLLSDATSSAQVLPLPTTLNNTTVKLGDLTLPLFYTNNGTLSQLNALVPYETPLNTNLQLLVQRDNTYATPVYVDVAAAQPGVLEYGNAEAVAVDLNGNLNGPSSPAHAGDLLTMYCLGLGAVSPAVADGAAAPSNPPASTVNTVTVTVGGQTANVLFAGLTPTLAGLYQINFYVPQNAGTGDQVPVVLSTAGQTSVAVNLSVR